MFGIGPELPLQKNTKFGNFSLLTSYKEAVKQNFKNLILTSPGERVMNPDFGVGMRQFLFEPREHVIPQIRQRIENQVKKYMPFIEVKRIAFDTRRSVESALDSISLSVTIEYEVPSLSLLTELVLSSGEIG
jgi:phage baseplate assembly protein W|tara:strand:+ start:29158 stop:29553 length:396 start_codon:yes stop_codon:yes gene_type:complete